jgi:hypothetical protein
MTESNSKWVPIKKQWCDILQDEAELLEQRVYPSEVIPDMEGYRVTGHKCTAAITCNLIGCQCQWSYTGPGTDRFAE